MNINKWVMVGNSFIAVNAQNGVVGVLKPLDDQIYDVNVKRLTGAVKRAEGGVKNEPIRAS